MISVRCTICGARTRVYSAKQATHCVCGGVRIARPDPSLRFARPATPSRIYGYGYGGPEVFQLVETSTLALD